MPRWTRSLLIPLVIAALAALPAGTSASAPACPAEAEAGLSLAELERSVLCLLNLERSSRGQSPVRPNAQLRSAALRHSTAMVASGFFDHTAPSGQTFTDRIRASGYLRRTSTWLIGENLIWGRGTSATPATLVRAWMRSPAHRRNVLTARFREIGVAAVRGTPVGSGDRTGVTITTKYGFRRLQSSAAAKRAKRKRARAKAKRRARAKRARAKRIRAKRREAARG